MGVYQGKITGWVRESPKTLCLIVIPQVSGTKTLKAKLPPDTDSPPKLGVVVWVSYEGEDSAQPVIIGGVNVSLKGGVETLDDLHDVNATAPEDGEVIIWRTDAWVNEENRRAVWRGVYAFAGTSYERDDMVRDADWLMIANQDTDERPAPQPIGDPYPMFDGVLTSEAHTAKHVICGQQYAVVNDGWLTGWRVYAHAGQTYSVWLVEDPSGERITTQVVKEVADTTGWVEFNVAPVLVHAGTSFDLLVDVTNTAQVEVTWAGNWYYLTPNNSTTPGIGGASQSKKEPRSLRMHKTDDDDGDRSAELLALTSGDQVTAGGITWTIQSLSDAGVYVDFTVTPETQASAQVHEFTFNSVTASPITIDKASDYWPGSAFPQTNGLFTATGGLWDAVSDDHAYGLDVIVQAATLSEHWDVMAVSGGGSGGGGGGVTVTHGAGAPPAEGSEGDLHIEYGVSDTLPDPDTAWAEMVLEGTWEQYSSSWGAARYKRVNGIVYLNIMVRYGAINTNITTLPIGFRPAYSLIYAGYQSSNNSAVRFNVLSGGVIQLATAAATDVGYFNLNVSYPAEQ